MNSVCRICLAVGVRMLSLEHLQGAFEKMTSSKLYLDKRPWVACYICHTQLRKSHTLIQTSAAAEKMLTEHLYAERSLDSVSKLDRQALVTLTREPTVSISVTHVEEVKVWIGTADDKKAVKLNEDSICERLVEDPAIDVVETKENAVWKGDAQQSRVVCDSLQPSGLPDTTAGDSDTAAAAEYDSEPEEPAPLGSTTEKRHKDKSSQPTGLMSIHKYEDRETATKRIKSLELVTVDDRYCYVCHFCQMALEDYKLMRIHLKKHKIFKCTACDKSFAQKSSFPRHWKYHKGIKPYKCETCNKSFTEAMYLKAHQLTHSGVKPYECHICHHKFTLKPNLRKHMTIHTGEKPYECDICNKRFREKHPFQMHMKKHKGEIEVQCDLCGQGFCSKSDLQKHLRAHPKSIDVKPFQCSQCSKRFGTKAGLAAHVYFNHSAAGSDASQHKSKVVKQFSCEECPYTTNSRINLQTHMFSHTGEKPLECDVCGRRFARRNELEQHNKIHTGEKPFECKICERKFRAKYTLDTHIRTHTGEKPYPCTVCNRSFAQKSTLKGHLKTHARKSNLDIDS